LVDSTLVAKQDENKRLPVLQVRWYTFVRTSSPI
jgi:hypothetical protein